MKKFLIRFFTPIVAEIIKNEKKIEWENTMKDPLFLSYLANLIKTELKK